MLFVDPIFLAFFAVVFAVSWSLRGNASRKAWLLVASYVFYAAWDWRFVSLIAISTAVDYAAGRAIAGTSEANVRRRWLLASVVTNLTILGAFKYFDFFVDSALAVFSTLSEAEYARPALNVVLPVGISFYTFQSMSYTLDIYRRRIEPERSPVDFALFVAFFPQLVAGPIVRARTFLPQLAVRPRLAEVDFRSASWLFLRGFIKKACIADAIGPVVDSVFADPTAYSTQSVWLAAVLFAIQVYCDFSGYTDMAIGCARALGYELTRNFHFPFLALNIEDFWRRWHISLATWFRDYVQLPLRESMPRQRGPQVALLITMSLVGLWHGAAWTFVVWGTAQGVGMLVYRGWRRLRGPIRDRGPLSTIVATATTGAFFSLTGIFFRAESFADAWSLLCTASFVQSGPEQLDWRLALVVAGLGALHVAGSLERVRELTARLPVWAYGLSYGGLAAVALAFVPMRTAPFIYFQF